jgi:hypothetical protein
MGRGDMENAERGSARCAIQSFIRSGSIDGDVLIDHKLSPLVSGFHLHLKLNEYRDSFASAFRKVRGRYRQRW